MEVLTKFFGDSASSLGVFYPTGYIIAVFPTFASAQAAARALARIGLADNEVLAIPGSEALRFFEEFRANSGLWAGVMSMLSRAFGTEQIFTDADVHRAEAGEGFLAVHSPEEAQTRHIQQLMMPFEPDSMQWYRAGGVETL
jgi:hypothetical protein